MLDLDLERKGATPRDAATLVLVRDAPSGRLEVFCVERHAKSAFLGGALVFPGGKVDAGDLDPDWGARSTPPRPAPFAAGEAELRALSVAACREALEEAAILPLAGRSLSHEALLGLRARAKDASLLACLSADELVVDSSARFTRCRAGSRRRPSPVGSTPASSSRLHPPGSEASTTNARRPRVCGRPRPRRSRGSRGAPCSSPPPPTGRSSSSRAPATRLRRFDSRGARTSTPSAHAWSATAPGKSTRWLSFFRATPSTTCAKSASPGRRATSSPATAGSPVPRRDWGHLPCR